ncbi:hypothetical protein VKT23_016236 [Stygiomarasmius scandens]|uniref:Uncharacterized protein n=1 Tax=Marasmiellus scandens TaxID=2682957 RepID=A0ABR1J018_9AGAR
MQHLAATDSQDQAITSQDQVVTSDDEVLHTILRSSPAVTTSSSFQDHSMSPPTHSHATVQDDMIMDPSGAAHGDGIDQADLSIDTALHSSTLPSELFTFVAPARNMEIVRQTIPSEIIAKPLLRRRIVKRGISNEPLQTEKQTEKRKRADGEEEESQKVFVMDSGLNDELVYRLRMDISDLQRANKSLQDEVVAFKALDPSLVNDIDISIASPRERKLVAVINSLKNQAEQLLLASDSGLANFEPATDNERKLLTRVNHLEALNDADKTQKEVFMTSLKNAELRNLQTARPPNEEIDALRVQVTCLLDDKTALQQRITSYQKAERQSSAADAALCEQLQELLIGLEEATTKVNNNLSETTERPLNDASDGHISSNEESSQASLPGLGTRMVTRVRHLTNEIDKLCRDKNLLVDLLSQVREDNSTLSAERDRLARQEEILQNLSSERNIEIQCLNELIGGQNSIGEELTKARTENSDLLRRLKEMEEAHEVEKILASGQNDRAIELEDLKADLAVTRKDYDSEKQKLASLQQVHDETLALLEVKVAEYNQEKQQFGTELSVMQVQKENLCKEKSKLTQDLEDLTTTWEQSQKALVLKQSQTDELKDSVKTLENANKQLRDHLRLVEAKRDELSQKEEVLQNTVDEAQRQKSTLEVELREVAEIHQQQMEELKAIYNQTKLEIEGKLKASNEKLEELQKSNQTEFQHLKGDANSAKTQAELLQRELDALKAEKQNLENVKSQIEGEKLLLQKQSQESNKVHQQQLEGLKEIYNQTRIDLESKLKTSNKELEMLKETEEAKIQHMSDNLDQAQASICSLQSQLDSLQVQYEAEKQSNTTLEQQIVNLQTNTGDHGTSSNTLKAQLEDALRDLTKANNDLDSTCRDLAKVKVEKEKMDSDMRLLLEKVEAHKQAYTKMKASRAEYIEYVGKCKAVLNKSNEEKDKMYETHKKQINELKSSVPSSSSESRERDEIIRNQKDRIDSLEKEVTALKSSTASSSSGQQPLEPADQWFAYGRKTLGGANVTAELLHAKASETSANRTRGNQYRLGNVIQTSSTVPWGNKKPSRFTKAGRRARKGNPGGPPDSSDSDSDDSDDGEHGEQPSGSGGGDPPAGNDNADISSDESEEGDDGKGERDDHTVRRKWQRMGIQKRYTPGQQAINANRLARALVLTCLGSKYLFEAFARDSVDDDHLQNFNDNPDDYGP